MIRWVGIFFGTLRSSVRTHRELALENLAAAASNSLCGRRVRAAATADGDGPGFFWVPSRGCGASWRHALQVVRPRPWFRGTGRDSTLLGVEESAPTRSAQDLGPSSRSDSADEPRQSPLGCTKIHGELLSWPNGLAGDQCRSTMVPASEAAVAGVANILEESRRSLLAFGFSSRCRRRPFESCSCS